MISVSKERFEETCEGKTIRKISVMAFNVKIWFEDGEVAEIDQYSDDLVDLLLKDPS